MEKNISKDDCRLLLKLARKSILQEFHKTKDELVSIIPDSSLKALTKCCGVFVCLHKKGDLKGCIGIIEPVKPLCEGVIEYAKHAAFHDTRFNPLCFEEMKDIKIEVSILTCPEKLEYNNGEELISKIRPGIDGVIIEKRFRNATFLPQVWKQLKDPEDFLSQLCMKAGLPPCEWKKGNLTVSTYQVQVIEEKE